MTNKIVTDQGPKDIYSGPNTCPFCHKTIVPLTLSGQINDASEPVLEAFLACPNFDCKKTFIGYYIFDDFYLHVWKFTGEIAGGIPKGIDFNESIKSLSPSFSRIYNQSFYAEQIGLDEICGVGYRKALEFLIKDYAKAKYPDKHTSIENKFLGPCINDYVGDLRIKKAAERAVWLGNDETHYVRKWNNKDIQDLKTLVHLVIHWIEMEILTDSLETEMPR